MKPLTNMAPRFGRNDWLARNRCGLVGWVIGWASFTYGTALIRVVQTGADEAGALGFGHSVFATADAVPPHAKIGFGLAFGLLLIAGRRAGLSGAPAAVAAGLVAAIAAMWLLPFDYFLGGGRAVGLATPLGALPHVLMGAAAGLVQAVARARCQRKLEAGR